MKLGFGAKRIHGPKSPSIASILGGVHHTNIGKTMSCSWLPSRHAESFDYSSQACTFPDLTSPPTSLRFAAGSVLSAIKNNVS